MESVDMLVMQLTSKNAVQGCAAMDALKTESARSNAVYPYFDTFIRLSDDGSSYVRTRALTLIAANVRWDTDRKLDGALDQILTHILDEKPITSRQFIKLLPGVVRERPDLMGRIRTALTEANPSRYAESMRPLVEKDILAALKEIAAMRDA